MKIEQRERIDQSPQTEFYSGILLPGMVNAHAHLELSYLKGKLTQGAGFAQFAKEMGQKRRETPLEQQKKAAEYQDALMWGQGVEAVGDICNSNITFGLKKRSKIKYHSFVEVYGLNTHSVEKMQKLVEEAKELGISASLTPHSTYSLNRELFVETLKESVAEPLSLHFMETAAEAELYEKKGGLWEWYQQCAMECDFLEHYGSPLERVVSEIASERALLLVHNVSVGESELRRLKEHFGGRVTLVLSPRSNNFISATKPPVELIRESGVGVALGTDSLASNHSLSMVEEMRALGEVPLMECLRWATVGGAEALGMDKELGTLEVGKRPGVVLLNGLDLENMRLTEVSATKRLV